MCACAHLPAADETEQKADPCLKVCPTLRCSARPRAPLMEQAEAKLQLEPHTLAAPSHFLTRFSQEHTP